MNGLRGMVENEGFVRRFLHMLAKKLLTSFEKLHVDFFDVEVRSTPAASVIIRVRMFGQMGFIQQCRWRHWNSVTINVGIEPIGGRTTGRSEEVIKPAIERPTIDTSRVIDRLDGFRGVLYESACRLCRRTSVRYATCQRTLLSTLARAEALAESFDRA